MQNNLIRLLTKLSTTTIAFRYKSRTKFLAMQNPFEVPTYQVGNQTYRRNCPLEMVNTTNPAAVSSQKFNEMEEEEERSCEMIEETTSSTLLEIREEPGETQSAAFGSGCIQKEGGSSRRKNAGER
ncbi:unnamed protein product [Meloidogyne enterolobii]|uniref:Uncharacterized protein n=1 Tax=Meloidogyne enterolobii TaxID=390850 RepID=A0ACB1A388_MELEN